MTGLLKRLDEKGYILCVPNAKDKGKKNIYLTEKAYDIQRRMEAERRKLDRELTADEQKRSRCTDEKSGKASIIMSLIRERSIELMAEKRD